MRLRLTVAAVAVASCLAASCGGLVDPSENTTETFSGTAPKGGLSLTTFQVSRNGEYFITLVSLTPPLSSNLPTGIRLTAEAGGSCVSDAQIVGDNPNAVAGRLALNGVIASGRFCLWVSDQGAFPTDEVFVITVSHP